MLIRKIAVFLQALILSNSKKKTIMKKTFVILAAVGGLVGLGGCSEQVNNDVILEEIAWGIPENQGVLRVSTRSDASPQEGMVYVFDSEGNCVKVLSTDEGGQLAATQLAVGAYSVYAIGSDDLSAYTLPDLDDAATTSVIRVAEGKAQGDLFMKAGSITLTAGNASNLALELERQVIQLKELTIKQVPTDVTKVEVSISPLHQGVRLDGMPCEGQTSLTLVLSKLADNTTWGNGEHQPYCFPSDGEPTITVSFTRTSGVKRYSYQASEAFEANHQLVIEGTYSEQQDALLSGSLTAKAWGAERSMPFEFDEANLVGGDSSENLEELEVPVAGGTYRGYYVVSVNDASKRAVILSKTQDNGIGNAAAMESKASQIEKPVGEGISCGEWRLPTIEECRAFLGDHNVEGKLYNTYYYCIDGDILKMMSASKANDVITVKGPLPSNNSSAPYENGTYLRAVIDITY